MLPITHQVTATLQEGEPFTMSGEKEATPAFFKAAGGLPTDQSRGDLAQDDQDEPMEV